MALYKVEGQGKIFDDNSDLIGELVTELTEADFQKIVLGGHSYGVDACEAIAQVLQQKEELKECDFSDIFTGRLRSEIPKCVTDLSNALLDKELDLLDFSDNAFGPDGAESVAPLLVQNRNLKVLKLNNNGLGPEGGKIIAAALGDDSVGPCQLEVFISGRGRLENEGCAAVAEAFEKVTTLKEVRIPQNGIYKEGLTAILKAFLNNPDLEVIDFYDNNISGGIDALATALKSLKKLKELNLGDCYLKADDSKQVVEALRENETLEILDMTYAEVNDETIMLLVEVLENKPNLKKLELNGNHLKDEGKSALEEFLESVGKADILGTLSDNESESFDDDEFYDDE
eukprot:TRINITY_DN10727_c0_g1_i1.p1 TRINITY_DN10727_c0_g1~~TRINITY_DN10727_c0_g1_i1.p1  ORF type:complete len:344 (-),score=122.95 TRINITY_DN10727_c0_g1_i1:20-1051(-)